MKAKQIKEQYVYAKQRDKVGVIAHLKDGSWYHVHNNEDVPDDLTISLHVRS